MRIIAQHGRIEVPGRVAAQLTDCVFNGDSADWTVKARCHDVDEFWLDGGGLALMLRVGKSQWRWRDVAVTRAGNDITIAGRGRPEMSEWHGT